MIREEPLLTFRRKLAESDHHLFHLPNLLCFVALLFALWHAYSLRWVSEDAYISFRYARNLIEGHGLVFNPGERVEGYTNFLWTLLLAGGLTLHLSPQFISASLGLLFTCGTFSCLSYLHRKLFPDAIFPAFLFALASNYTWACFSTSGLETSLLVFLLSAAFMFLAYGSWIGTSLFLVFALLTRPDAAIPAAIVFGTLLFRLFTKKETLTSLWLFLLPFLLIYLPYFLWRTSYYGYLFPNTYFAKAAYLSYYGQGLIYLWEFVRRYHLWALIPWTLLIPFRKPKDVIVILGIFCLLYAFYVVRVGGDFMEGRFFIPVLPFVYLLVESSFRVMIQQQKLLAISLSFIVLTSAMDRPVIEPMTIRDQIADERTWEPLFLLWYKEGAIFGKHLPPGTWVATDAIGAFGYASRLPIVDTLGLTDETVAHLTLTVRSRPGHEKVAPIEYLYSRSISILRDGIGSYENYGQPYWFFAGTRYYLLKKDPNLQEAFGRAVEEIRAELTRTP